MIQFTTHFRQEAFLGPNDSADIFEWVLRRWPREEPGDLQEAGSTAAWGVTAKPQLGEG